MRFFDGEKLEVVLKPTDFEISRMVETSRKLMLEKMDRWILDQLTIEQLKNCVKQFQAEIERRELSYSICPKCQEVACDDDCPNKEARK